MASRAVATMASMVASERVIAEQGMTTSVRRSGVAGDGQGKQYTTTTDGNVSETKRFVRFRFQHILRTRRAAHERRRYGEEEQGKTVSTRRARTHTHTHIHTQTRGAQTRTTDRPADSKHNSSCAAETGRSAPIPPPPPPRRTPPTPIPPPPRRRPPRRSPTECFPSPSHAVPSAPSSPAQQVFSVFFLRLLLLLLSPSTARRTCGGGGGGGEDRVRTERDYNRVEKGTKITKTRRDDRFSSPFVRPVHVQNIIYSFNVLRKSAISSRPVIIIIIK